MCGICGLYTSSIFTEIADILPRMNQALTHRGPDEAGHYYHQACGIAMRRLSIIDVAGGHQPIFNENEQLAIVFNGEIYNFQPLRDMLRGRGHRFQTQSDTEVIIHLYEDESENTPLHLKGMFAFCIYDRRDDSLFIARDRFGEKPLYYHYHPENGFVFSSEIKSLLQCPFVPRRLDYEALGYYMRVGYIPAPLTMLKDVHILPPGHWLKWHDGNLVIRPYYTIGYRPDPTLEREADAVDAVKTVLHEAVKRQSISDVPLGAFLSGGIDSSCVVAMLQSISTHPVKTFTIRFEEESYDEGAIAKQVAEHLRTEHHEFIIPNVAFEPDDLWRVIDHIGLPFVDSTAIPTYVLSKYVGQEVKVALSGDGGDELFAGYPFFQWGLTIRRMQTLPRPLIDASAQVANWLSQQPLLSDVSGLRRIRRGLKGAASPTHLLPVIVHSVFEPGELAALLRCESVLAVATGDLPLVTALPADAETWSPLRQLMYYRLKHMLPDRMLRKVDRMSMAASLEVRAPMLDVDLAALSMRLPDKHLLQNGVGKLILRKAMEGKVPDVVFAHPKSGFTIPLHRFHNEKYKAMAHDLLYDQEGIMQLFAQEAIEDRIRIGISQQSNRADRSVYQASHQLWALMQLAAWGRRFKVSL